MTRTKRTIATFTRIKKWSATSLVIGLCLAFSVTAFNCGPAGQEIKTTPEPAKVEPKEPAIEDLRKPVAVDTDMFKAVKVLIEFGKHAKKHITYEKFQELTGGQPDAAVNPDWFYDNYVIDINEDNYWVNVICQSSTKATENDPRIKKVMGDLPSASITVTLTTPKGKKYLLNDSQADGILDFAKEADKETDMKIDIKLLDTMQEKYTWVLNLIKKHYKK